MWAEINKDMEISCLFDSLTFPGNLMVNPNKT